MSIRQAIGRGALNQARPLVPHAQKRLVDTLTTVLSYLFPISSAEDIQMGVAKFVEIAIELKNAMTSEQAIYYCYWLESGEKVHENIAESSSEEVSGTTMLCTFPGLKRIASNDRDDNVIIVVKATVELEAVDETESAAGEEMVKDEASQKNHTV